MSFLRDLLHGQGKTHEFHTYPGVDHGFVNTMIKTHDAAAAKDAWSKALGFLETHLGHPDALPRKAFV